MKTSLRLLALLPLLAAAARGGDFIRQIQTVNGNPVAIDIPINGDTGQVVSNPLTAETAVFQLFTTVTENNVSQLLKLDEKTVGTFMPTVTIEALSEDPAVPARTRADRPYGIRVTVSNLREGPDVPEFAKSVQLVRGYQSYDATTYVPTGNGGEYADSFTFRRNGTFVDSPIYQRLPVDLPTRAVGEETFTAYIHPDIASTLGELASASIKIWPVARATITGIEEGRIYRGVPQFGSVAVRDIYPGASVYGQVYKGSEKLGTVGAVLEKTAVSYKDASVPQNALLPIGDLAPHLAEDGTYTVEILTVTPFHGGAPERLAHVTFSIDRTIDINGSLNTLN